jgi:transposase
MDKYIGLDVHATSCTAAIVDARGKRLGHHVLETNGQVLVEFFKTLKGVLHVCMEEGTQAGWLVEILSPHAQRVVALRVPESRGAKSDERDAFGLAERLRTGAVDASVYKQVGPFATLRQLVKAHQSIVRDVTRTKNRIKAVFRSRGVSVVGKGVYSPTKRDEYLCQLPASSRAAALLLFEQYDALGPVRDHAEKQLVTESHRHPITRVLESTPGIGEVRAAQLVSVVVTPDRFRTRAQFWSYSGLGIVMRSSSDWVQTAQGKWMRAPVQQTRGLNRNHNRLLKAVFKGAATSVIQQYPDSMLRRDYDRLLVSGTKPNLAKLTLARKIAAITLALWKNKEEYDPHKTSKPTELVSSSAPATVV